MLITFIGHACDEPSVQETKNGNRAAHVTLAYNPQRYDRQTKQYVDLGEAIYVRVTAWNSGKIRTADNVAASIRKGDKVIAQGRLTKTSYTARDGGLKDQYELTADSIGVDLASSVQPSGEWGDDGF